MSGEQPRVTESELLAYVDGELDAEARARIERHVAQDPVAAGLVADFDRQNRRLGALYGPVAHEPVPERLRPAAMARGRRRAAPLWRSLAASAALLALGAGSGWYGRDLLSDGPAAQTLVAQAVEAHDLYASEVVHPVEVRAGERDHLRAWLSKRLDRALTLPDLGAQGLTLVGGRLLPGGDGPAAQIMYEDETGRRLTLFVVPAVQSGESALRYASLRGLEAVWWSDETVRCALVGDLPRDRLQAIATAAYAQLI